MATKTEDEVRLSGELRKSAEAAAKAEGATLDEFVAAAVRSRLEALQTKAAFEERAKRADFAAFDRFMNRPGGARPRPDDLLEE